MKTLYTAHGSATGGREGQAATDTGNVKLVLNTPKELGGGGGDGTNPEQLFALGYSACFLGALKFAAGKEKVKIPDDAKVSADIGIGPRDDGQGFGGQSTGTGIGLKNLRERLRLTFGSEASFAIVSNFPSGVAATLTLPLDGKAGAA